MPLELAPKDGPVSNKDFTSAATATFRSGKLSIASTSA
jgi:hypothetical protein